MHSAQPGDALPSPPRVEKFHNIKVLLADIGVSEVK